VYGLQYLLAKHRDLFRKDDLIIIPDSGNPTGTEIEVAEKGILWLKFRTLGKQTHGSMPATGINAHKAAAYLTVRMESLYTKFRKRDPLFSRPIRRSSPPRRKPTFPTSIPFRARTSSTSTAACCRATPSTRSCAR